MPAGTPLAYARRVPTDDQLPPVLAVVGPTGAGKSDLGVDLALALGGEVVNADSMQLYEGMDIGTAKLTPEERRGVPHHLLDVWSVTEAASVQDFQARGRRVVDRLRAAGTPVVVVGGSGLYLRGLLDALEFPGTDPVLRAELTAHADAEGSAVLHAELAALDPAAARLMEPSNARRVVRALEVVRLTGRPFPTAMADYTPYYPATWIGLDPGDPLDDRLALRVDRMLAAGLVAEVERLVCQGLREGPTARAALGYAQVLAHLGGRLDLDGVREQTVTATRRFARRQRRWFRPDPRTHWYAAVPTADEVLARTGPQRREH